jgi:hypothetical protein
MVLSQAAVFLWSIPVILQILLPLALLTGFLLLKAGRYLFGINLRSSVEPRLVKSLASEKV